MKFGCLECVDVRVAWACGAAQMLAILALSSLALEECLTLMARPAHTLRRCSPGHLFPTCAVYHGESTSLLL